ncbi:hypothetical protein BDF14DRAFT_1752626 [Spinellus fusiger]|nr:hypothetical protein BDF14DRAFT_1752626 [Spinellus fusiger]
MTHSRTEKEAYTAAEHSLVLNKPLDAQTAQILPEVLCEAVQDTLKGNYSRVLEHSPLFDLTLTDTVTALAATGDIDTWLSQRIATLPKDTVTRFHLLITGVVCLHVFVQINWTGPVFHTPLASLLTTDADTAVTLTQHLQAYTLQSLAADSEEVYHLTEQLGWLAMARHLLLSDTLRHHTTTAAMWAQRAVFLQQQLLDEGAGSLQSLLQLLHQESTRALGLSLPLTSANSTTTALGVRHALDRALVHSYYGQDKEAYEKMKEAQATSGLIWSLTGALGRRTKFQTFDVSQLVLHAESQQDTTTTTTTATMIESGAAAVEPQEVAHPETLPLNDDTLLDSVAYASTTENDQDQTKRHGNLNIIDQCLLLAFCCNVKNTNPDHGITSEEMKPYVVRVAENVNNWMVHTMALLLRTRLESDKSRTVERSALQLQALVDQIKVEDSGAEERLAYFYDLPLPSKWAMERELAQRFISLGVVRSALEIFERLELWEDVVACYQMLEQPAKARRVIEQLMQETPQSPKLWCLLGDVEVNPDYWQKAWTLSNHTFARAMRSLGAYHYKHHDYAASIDCYQKALSINPLFEGSWYVLGCAAMQAEQWEVGMRAFQRVVALDQEQAEAWNNLSSIYLHLDRKPDAYLALKQATRINYSSWKMWQNLLYVSVDLGQFADAIWAMQRIVDMRWDKVREEAVDVPVLRLIVESVVQNWKDAHDREGVRLAGQVQRLLEDVILTRITNSPDIWSVASKFYLWQKKYTQALESSVKAYRSVMHDVRIETDAKRFEEVANVALDTVDMYENLGEKKVEGVAVCSDWKYQSRLIVKGLMGKTRDVFDDTTTYERLKERLEDLKQA